MNLEIKQNGIDVTEKMSLTSGLLFDRLGGGFDNIKLEIPASTEIEINKYDRFVITADDYTTGTMYVDGCGLANDNSLFSISALSAKASTKIKHSRIWNDVTLFQIINDVASNCGLQIKTYDIANYTYAVVSQFLETDLAFLSRVCIREGYSVKVDNGCLIVFNDYALEHDYTAGTLDASETASANFNRSINGLSSFTVLHYDIEKGRIISHTAKDSTIDGGSNRVVEYLTDIAEAERFAKGYLRNSNKNYVTGRIMMDFNTKVSAGTVLDLTGFEEYDARYIVSELVHDVVNEKTCLTVRNILSY